MREDIAMVAACLGVFAAIFLTAGIIPLVIYFGLKKGTNAVAEVTEHVCEENRMDKGRVSRTWLLKMKYSVNGVEYEKNYGVAKSKEYMDSHPVGTVIKIIVNSRDPKKFVFPEDTKKLLLPGIIFSAGGIGSLAGMISLLIRACSH